MKIREIQNDEVKKILELSRQEVIEIIAELARELQNPSQEKFELAIEWDD